jgi:hypothetical protein
MILDSKWCSQGKAAGNILASDLCDGARTCCGTTELKFTEPFHTLTIDSHVTRPCAPVAGTMWRSRVPERPVSGDDATTSIYREVPLQSRVS